MNPHGYGIGSRLYRDQGNIPVVWGDAMAASKQKKPRAERRPRSFADVLRLERRCNARARKAQGIASGGEWGLALSGGGVRSATFCLGVLQWLVRSRRIADFDYLSTVSGGGYIGGWLVALLHRFGSLDRLTAWRLDASVAYLRRYSNYLTPHAGLFSLDALAGAAIYLRNLLLNAAMLVAVLSAALFAPILLSALAAALVGYGHHVAAWLAAVLFLWVAFWVGYAGPSSTPPRSRFRREHFAGLAISLPLLPAFLLEAHGLMAYSRSMAGAAAIEVLFNFVVAGAVAYGLLSLVAYLAWSKARYGRFFVSAQAAEAQRKRELLDSPEAFSLKIFVQHALFTLLAGSLGGALLWVIQHYLAGWLATAAPGGRQGFASLLPQLYQADPQASHVIAALLVSPAMFLAGFCTLAVHVAVCRRLLTEHDREWSARWIAAGGRLLLLWWSACLLAVATPPLVHAAGKIGWGALLAWLAASGMTARFANAFNAPAAGRGGIKRRLLVALGPYVFVAGALVLVALLNFELAAAAGGRPSPLALGVSPSWSDTVIAQQIADIGVWRIDWARLALLCALPVGFAFVAGFAVDVNLFSFQSFYRNRLTRCYLGASHFVDVADAQKVECRRWGGMGGRTPHSPTDLDPEDDMRLADLGRVRPYPIVNTALNLNVSSETAWQHRKAASFAFTPLLSGFQFPLCFDGAPAAELFGPPAAGRWVAGAYRPTRHYLFDGNDGPKLGLPIAISGAAFTGNAGFHTTPWMTFLLTVFGVRLGRWCSNPGVEKTWKHAAPRNSLGLLVDELLGRTSEARPYVYLSDGGHFENLGIYELVRRGCVRIVAIDVSADPDYAFDDLANAIHKCRVDFGVEISFADGALKRLQRGADGRSSAAVAVGRIVYPQGVEEGMLIYVKPALIGTEPEDIIHYHSQNARFPHETTVDQWFSESQFESYRRLGEHIAERQLSSVLEKRD